MKPKLTLTDVQLQGYLKVSATVHYPEVKRVACHNEMPVLQIQEAGVMVELEFLDDEGLRDFAHRVGALAEEHQGRERG